MHILLTIPSLSKKSGGPATVVQHLSEHLAISGACVSVLTSVVEPGQSEALPRDQRVKVVHVPAGGRSKWRPSFGGPFQTALEQNLGSENDTVVHDFGLWLPANHAVVSGCERRGVKLACSTCGMLAPWALRHKAWKKKLAWWLYQRQDLSRAALLVATSEQEAQDIRRLAPGKNIALIPNGVELPKIKATKRDSDFSVSEFQLSAFSPSEARGQRSEIRSQRTAVFLGRIHPVKGLKNLVEAWHLVRPAGWRCILAGPDEAGHRKELETLSHSLNLANVFEFPGMMGDDQKWALLRGADLFVLPSFTENFGVAAAEALACGVPVITTKGTPWEELRTRQCGWWVDIGVEPLVAALREATELSDQERYEMGQRGRRLVEEKYSWPKIGRDMMAVYQWVLGQGPKPECVIPKS
jgi:glycosyltransferase involved in cell wall biosynthesis